ncbi:hypothetical protein PVAP13_3NG193000 [Panicum virgatum]|uniref:Uncharacterized protein n=1 Tax=Panicum virgatum TaxID=38727 RepID=A0A8T0U9N9_PANVG|nr:hypothetical protein PVAP13_3NG193000 [Panicum virgatum]
MDRRASTPRGSSSPPPHPRRRAHLLALLLPVPSLEVNPGIRIFWGSTAAAALPAAIDAILARYNVAQDVNVMGVKHICRRLWNCKCRICSRHYSGMFVGWSVMSYICFRKQITIAGSDDPVIAEHTPHRPPSRLILRRSEGAQLRLAAVCLLPVSRAATGWLESGLHPVPFDHPIVMVGEMPNIFSLFSDH